MSYIINIAKLFGICYGFVFLVVLCGRGCATTLPHTYCLDKDHDSYVDKSTCKSTYRPPDNYVRATERNTNFDGHIDVGDLSGLPWDCDDTNPQILGKRMFYFDYDYDGLGNKNFSLISSCREVWTNTDPDDCDNWQSDYQYKACLERERVHKLSE